MDTFGISKDLAVTLKYCYKKKRSRNMLKYFF